MINGTNTLAGRSRGMHGDGVPNKFSARQQLYKSSVLLSTGTQRMQRRHRCPLKLQTATSTSPLSAWSRK